MLPQQIIIIISVKLHTTTSRGLARWHRSWLAYFTCWLPPKKLLKVDRSVRRKEKHGRRNDSFPCVCTPPFMFTVISCKIYSIYFDYKRLKFMLLRNEICKKKSSRLIFLWITNGDSYLKKTSNITEMRRAYIVELAVLLSPQLPLLDPSLKYKRVRLYWLMHYWIMVVDRLKFMLHW